LAPWASKWCSLTLILAPCSSLCTGATGAQERSRLSRRHVKSSRAQGYGQMTRSIETIAWLYRRASGAAWLQSLCLVPVCAWGATGAQERSRLSQRRIELSRTQGSGLRPRAAGSSLIICACLPATVASKRLTRAKAEAERTGSELRTLVAGLLLSFGSAACCSK
jgi:hypothetical protein